jgi:hypothetical protein
LKNDKEMTLGGAAMGSAPPPIGFRLGYTDRAVILMIT